MKIEQLIYFIETAKQEHVGKAAKILGISPSAISHSVAALENELRAKLFEKKGKSIFLTPAGRNLLQKSERLVGEFQGLQESLGKSETQIAHYRIAATHFLASTILAPTWGSLAQEYPQVTVELFTLRSADVVKGVLNQELDFGICFSPQAHPDLVQQVLKKGELQIFTRKGHPFLKQRTRKLSQLSEYPAVLPKAFQGIEVCVSDPMFVAHSLVPKSQTAIDSYEVMVKLVEESDAWGFAPDLVVGQSKKREVVKVSQGKSPYEITAIWRRDRFTPALFAKLVEESIPFLNRHQ